MYVSIIQFITGTIINYNIDELYGLRHSLATMFNAHNIYSVEKNNNPWLEKYDDVIYTGTLIHDLIDSKYILKK